MSVPNTFASATTSIPLANLDANFAYYDAAFAISGTAVTFAGSITLTTGTANGVPYLNASKVLTSGAVLTFDGTTLSSTKFAGALNGTVGATTATTGAFTTLSTTGAVTITGGTANGVGYLNASKVLTTGTALTFDGTNFGVGTASYGNAATIAAAIGVPATTTGGLQLWSPTTGVHWVQFGDGTAGDGPYRGAVGYDHTVDALRLYAAAIEVGRITSTGLAVTGTLSATSNIYTSARYFAQRQSGSLSFAIGGYSDGSAATVLTGAIGDIVAFGNVGGDGVIFANSNTERMRLTDTGLGIGTSSPAYRLDVGATSDVNISMNNSTSVTSGNRGTLSMYNSAGSTVGFIRFGAVTDNSGTDIQFGVRPAGGSLNSTAMKLDSSGNLLVGNTVASSATDAGFKFLKSLEGAGNDRTAIVFDSSSNSQIPFTLYSTGAGAYRFYVGAGGTIYATSIVITAISDQRLKENVRDIDTGLSSVMALKPRRFDWKEGKGQDKKNVAGFIAQEFEDVFPECVGVSRAGEDGVEYKNINHETLIPTLVKAIQELKAEFDAYKASHP